MDTKKVVQEFLQHPSMEKFDIIRESALALQLAYHLLEEKNQLTRFFGFGEWILIYEVLPEEDKQTALQKMMVFATTLERMQVVYGFALGETRKSIAQKMRKICTTFREWEYIYNHSNGELQKQAFEEMKKLVE
ncbi:MAG: hypothetical protein WCJ45_08890 [bacterium]